MKKIYILYILSELTNKPNTPDIEKPSTSLHAHTKQAVNNLNYIAWNNTARHFQILQSLVQLFCCCTRCD